MKIGVAISPLLPFVKDIQEFLEDIFAELDDLKDIEIHAQDLDEFSIFLLNLAKNKGVSYSIHCPHMYSKEKVNFCSAEIKDIEKADFWMKKSIKYAKELNSKYIIIHPDLPKSCSKKKALDILESHIKNNINLLNKNQKILIENMPGKKYCLSTPLEFQGFLKRFNKKIAVCWDIGHEIIRFKNQNFTFSRLKSKIKEVHISGISKYHDHYSLTKGNLDLKKCIKSLKKINYKGIIIFEIVTDNPSDIIESKEKIDKIIQESK